MNIFVSVIPKDKNLIEKYIKSIRRAAEITVPFYDKEHESNIWDNGKVIVANFSIHEKHVAIKKYASFNESSYLTFNGIPSIPELVNEEFWSDIFLKMAIEKSLDYSSVKGYYNFLEVIGDNVTAYTSITRSEPIYWTETRECYVVGNKASLVYAVAHNSIKFDYNLEALISICTIGWQTHDEVQFKGVNILDNGSHIKLNSNGFQLGYHISYEKLELPYSNHYRMENLYNEIYDEIAQEFINGLKAFKGFSNEFRINLTGGKDSRVIAAFCKEAGLDFTTITSGGPEDRDVIVAKEVAEILGVEHRSTPKKKISDEIPKVDIFELLKRQVIQSDGSSNFYDSCYPVRLEPSVQFVGHGGALFKGGYGNSKKPYISNEKELELFIHNLSHHNAPLLLTDEAIKIQRDINNKIINKFRQSSFEIKDFYDYMYMVYREGRAMANSRQASGYGAFQNSIYLNSTAIRKALEIPLELRTNNKLYYNLLYNINPTLALHRFSDSRWDFEQDGPPEGVSRSDWEKRAPLPPTKKQSHQIRSWRLGYDEYLRPIIKDYLLSNRSSEIFNIVDYKKLEKVLNQDGPTNNNVIRSIFGIMTAAYLVNNDWYESPKLSLKEKIKVIFKKE
mgnify:CR=1 FL=1